MIEATG